MSSVQLLKPRSIFSIGLIFSVLIAISAYFELQQSRAELMQTHIDEGMTLLETISQSAANSVLSQVEIEDLISERLLSIARALHELEKHRTLDDSFLNQLATANHLHRINIFDRDGVKLATSNLEVMAHGESQHEPREFFRPILEGQADELEIGLKEARYTPGERYAVAVRRITGGAIVINIDAADMLAFRKRIGLGRLLESISHQPSLEYIALQDEAGILAATSNVTELSAYSGDPFLQTDTLRTRITAFNNRDVLEVIRPLRIKGVEMGLLRLGLHLDELKSLEKRMVRRAVILSFVIGFIGLVLISAVVINQNYALLRQEHTRIKTYTGNILQSMSDSVIGVNRKGTITFVNAAAGKLFQISTENLLNSHITAIFPRETAIYAHLQRGEPLPNFEEELRLTPGNRQCIFLVDISYVYDESGTIDIGVILIRDLTRQKRLEGQLQRQEKLTAMGELASGVAHEIRNPLNAVGVIIQRLQREFEPIADKDEYVSLVKTVRAETNRINDIIKQFLDFARPAKLNRSAIAVSNLIRDCVAVVESQARAQNIHIITEITTGVVFSADPAKLHQALLNILQNAIEAIVESGEIAIIAQQRETNLEIIIRDNGPGLPMEQQRKIFDLYFTTKPTGTGLGLPIAHRIITEHGGDLLVRSEPDQGTQLTIILPIDTP